MSEADGVTPTSALMEFAASCDRWGQGAHERSTGAKKHGDEGEALYQEGRADGFRDAGMAASTRATFFKAASAPSNAKKEFLEVLTVGYDARFELTVECVAGKNGRSS